jgi:hypothetical protein
MAQWRRPVELAPRELITYRPEDWVHRCEPNPWYYPMYGWPACKTPKQSWHHARCEWARTHPGSRALGGDAIDLLFEARD